MLTDNSKSSAGAYTVTAQFAPASPAMALIVHAPLPTAVTTPSAFTVATSSSLDSNLTSPVSWSRFVIAIVAESVSPSFSVISFGSSTGATASGFSVPVGASVFAGSFVAGSFSVGSVSVVSFSVGSSGLVCASAISNFGFVTALSP